MTVTHRAASPLRVTSLAISLLLALAVGPAFAQKIAVKSATPASGEQGAFGLDVVIAGTGFGNGAKAHFFLSGTDNPDGIVVKNTRFVSNTQLVATLDIASTASLASFDIKVTLGGRTGKGTDLFQVVQKAVACEAGTFRSNASLQSLPATRAPLACESGTLDCSFGDAGLSTAVLPEYALVMDSDVDGQGRILVLAESHSSANTTGFYLLRFTADGAVDSTFGNGGVSHVSFTSGLGNELPHSLAVQPDDAVIVAGSVPTKANSGSPRLAALARFLPNGSLDTTFGSGGKVTFSFGSSRSSSQAFAVALQSNGRIVVGGTSGGDFAAARLLASGAFDASFGSEGRVVVPMGSDARVGGIAVQADDGAQKIVIAGDATHCATRDVAVLRLDSAGVPDSGFGTRGDGRLYVDVANDAERIYAMTVDSTDRVVLAGTGNLSNHSAVMRLTADGVLDSSFGEDGVTRLKFDGLSTAIFNLLSDSANGVVVVGGARVPGTPQSDAFAVRLLPDGQVDMGFAAGGALLVTYPVGLDDDQAGGVVAQPNGRVVVVGRAVFNHVVLMGVLP